MHPTASKSVERPLPFGNELSMILGMNVEILRKKRGINKSRLCMMLGIGRPTLNRIEKGIHDARLSLIHALAVVLEVTDRELLEPHDKSYWDNRLRA